MARDHDEMRAIIIDAAREVFSNFGYKKATLDDIASSLYKAKSSIYYYFKSKEDVFRAVIDYESNRAGDIVRAGVEKVIDPEEKLRVYFRTIKDFVRETKSYYKLMQEEMLEVMSFAKEEKCRHKKEGAQFIASILQLGIDSGDFQMDNPYDVAETLQVAFEGIFAPWHDRSDEFDDKFDSLMNIVLNGIKKR